MSCSTLALPYFPARLKYLLVLALSLHVLQGNGSAEEIWKAGAASVSITPERSTWMMGYGSRRTPSQGTALDLRAKALALEDVAGNRLVVVTLDLLTVPDPVRFWLEEKLQSQFGLAAGSLLMNASHTHSGPEVRMVSTPLDELDPQRTREAAEYRAFLQDRLVQVVSAAWADLGEARLGYSRARAGFAMNRRLPTSEGFDNAPYPDGPVDHDVPVLRVERPDGSLAALLFTYACHNTTTAGFDFHGDYAGFAQAYLEEGHPKTVALFAAGCGGDQNPYPRRDMVPGMNDLDLARHHGRTLANAVETALEAPTQVLASDLRAELESIPLAYAFVPTREELERRAREAESAQERDYAAVLLAKLQREGSLPSTYRYPVQVIRLGDALTVVALAGETTVDYSLRLKNELSGAVWVMGYSNQFPGYVPSRRVLLEGGYEAGGAMVYSRETIYRNLNPAPWSASVEESIVSAVHALVRRVSAKGDAAEASRQADR